MQYLKFPETKPANFDINDSEKPSEVALEITGKSMVTQASTSNRYLRPDGYRNGHCKVANISPASVLTNR